MTRLERLIRDISPDRTIDRVARRVDEAINSFSAGVSQITQYEEFTAYIVRLCRHIEAALLCVPQGLPTANPEFELRRYLPVLTRAYGSEGIKKAFEMARTGNEGGLYAVMRKLGEILVQEHADNVIAVSVGFYWNSLTVDEKFAAVDEYLARYGHLLPSELTESVAGRVRANFPKFLQQHPRMVARLRQVGH